MKIKNLLILLSIGLFSCSTSADTASCCETKKECTKTTACCEMEHCDKDKCEGNCCDMSCCG